MGRIFIIIHLKPLQHISFVSGSKDDNIKLSFLSISELNCLAFFDAWNTRENLNVDEDNKIDSANC